MRKQVIALRMAVIHYTFYIIKLILKRASS